MAIFDKHRGRAKKRKAQIRAIPGVFDYSTLLYIGASPDRFEMVDLFFDAGYEITVLEAHEPNVDALHEINDNWDIFSEILHGDVRDIEKCLVHRYDVILFWHGLEHLREEDHAPVIMKLIDWSKHLLIFGQPWGAYEQPAVKGNKYERHVSALQPSFFEHRGFKTSIVGRRQGRNSNLVAWTKINEA